MSAPTRKDKASMITYTQVRDELWQLVIELGPNWTYPLEEGDLIKDKPETHRDIVCRYFTPDGKPSCIVGRWVSRHGLGPLPALESTRAEAMLKFLDLSLEPAAIRLLDAVQRKQDAGTPLAEAIGRAEEDAR